MLFELSPGRLDERSVVHARGTDSFTGPAIEALVHLLIELRIKQSQIAFGDRFHQPETSPWRRRFLARQTVGRTRGQAHTAMHASMEQIVIRNVFARKPMLDNIDE